MVLVIVGLLVAGIIVGKEMISNSERRAVGREIEEFKLAVQSFRLKYNCLPGDCLNATSFFGERDPVPATCITMTSVDGRTCNGNGDSKVRDNESYNFWQQLSAAGLVDSGFTGTAYATNKVKIGTNVPASALAGAGFTPLYFTLLPYSYLVPNVVSGRGHVLYFGGDANGTVSSTMAALWQPAEAKLFDVKLDDGMPMTGSIVPFAGVSEAGMPYMLGDPTTCIEADEPDEVSANYRIAYTERVCSFIIIMGF